MTMIRGIHPPSYHDSNPSDVHTHIAANQKTDDFPCEV